MRAPAQRRSSLLLVAFLAALALLVAVSVLDAVTASLDGLDLVDDRAAVEVER